MGEINISDILAITARTQSAAAPSSSFTAHHCQSTIRSDHENIKTFALSPIAWRCSWGHNSSHRKSVKSTTGSLGQECIARPGPEPADLTVRHSLLPLSSVSPSQSSALASQVSATSVLYPAVLPTHNQSLNYAHQTIFVWRLEKTGLILAGREVSGVLGEITHLNQFIGTKELVSVSSKHRYICLF